MAAQIHLACKRFVDEPQHAEIPFAVAGLHQHGENMLAFILANAALDYLQLHKREVPWLEQLQLLQAKVFHAMGSYQAAIVKLKALLGQAKVLDRAEVLGNLASVYKSLAMEATETNKRDQWLEEAYTYYVQCFAQAQLADNFWLGVNALTIAAARHHDEVVVEYLPVMVSACQNAIDQQPDDFWALATMAELGLIAIATGVPHAVSESCVAFYAAAQAQCSTPSQRKSARKNLPLLLTRLAQRSQDEAAQWKAHIDEALPPLRIACFSGHRIDAPGRANARFPANQQAAVKRALQVLLAEQHIEMGFCSLSNGGDMLFTEALLAQQRMVQAVLPFEPFQFLAESVRTFDCDDADWQRRYTQIMEDRSGHVFLWYAGRGVIDAEQASIYYEHANRVLFGLALLRAKEMGAQLQPIAVLNATEPGSSFGTKHTVNTWLAKGHGVICIDPITLRHRNLTPADASAEVEYEEGETVIRTLLFADLKGFSRFNDVQIDIFCQQLLPLIKRELDRIEGIEELNTWGDGLFVVFNTPQQGAEAGLKLCELMATPEVLALWHAAKLDGVPALRVSLHSAPVRRMYNPLTDQTTHWGTNINIAARIEPVTPINQVYASVATAALLAFDGSEGYHADFVGVVPLAKAFGAQEIFRVRRRLGLSPSLQDGPYRFFCHCV